MEIRNIDISYIQKADCHLWGKSIQDNDGARRVSSPEQISLRGDKCFGKLKDIIKSIHVWSTELNLCEWTLFTQVDFFCVNGLLFKCELNLFGLDNRTWEKNCKSLKHGIIEKSLRLSQYKRRSELTLEGWKTKFIEKIY